MDAEELNQLGRRARERLEEALDAGDRDTARRICAELPKEYFQLHKGQRQHIAAQLEYIERIFRVEQAALAARIATAVDEGRDDDARALLRERDRQHQVLHDQSIDITAGLCRYVGAVFGSALAAGGIFAFFLESGFLALLIFGWDRVGPKMHFFATVMVAVGGLFSSIWITVANSWQQTPAGFELREHVVNQRVFQRAEITDFWAMVLNPSSLQRLPMEWHPPVEADRAAGQPGTPDRS